MPVSLPNWALSKRSLKVNLSQKSAATKLLRNSNCIVNCSVAQSNCLRVDEVIDAKASRGREVRNHTPSPVLFGYHAESSAVERREGGTWKGARHPSSTTLLVEVVIDRLGVNPG